MLGDNIRFLRKQYNLTIKELAESLGSNYACFSKYENNVKQPPNTMLVKIADYFDVTIDMLLDRKQLELNIKSDYIKVFKKAESLNVSAEELDRILEFALKMKGKE